MSDHNLEVTDITNSISDPSEVACGSLEFRLYQAKQEGQEDGQEGRTVLLKVFNGLYPGRIDEGPCDRLLKAYLNGVNKWIKECSTNSFVTFLGICEDDDSIIPGPVYAEHKQSTEFCKELSNKKLIQFLHKIVEGINFMHQRSLVHGHIKGENILVDDDGNPRIADNSFGSIVGYLDEERQRELTAVISDLRWWPPEDFTQKDSEPRRPSKEGDIWSLGMTVFELWSGFKPYYETPRERVPFKIANIELPSVAILTPQIEAIRESINVVTSLCWRMKPEDRVTASKLEFIFQKLLDNDVKSVKEEFPDEGEVFETITPQKPRRNPFCRPVKSALTSTISSVVISTTSQNERDVDDEVAWGDIPRPPSPDTEREIPPLTRLLNMKVQHKLDTLEIVHPPMLGSPHLPSWMTIINFKGKLWVRAASHKKKEADEVASRTAIKKLIQLFPEMNISGYLPTFMKYIQEQSLQERIKFTDISFGDPHDLDWRSTIELDGYEIAMGSGKTKKAAEEDAARKAYNAWPRPD